MDQGVIANLKAYYLRHTLAQAGRGGRRCRDVPQELLNDDLMELQAQKAAEEESLD